MAGALLAEAVAVLVHPQQRGGGVGAQRVQAEPGVGHRGIEPDRGAELLLGLRIRAHGVRIDRAQPGEFGRGGRALRADVHPVPPQNVPPRCAPPGVCRAAAAPTGVRRAGVPLAARTAVRVPRRHRLAWYPRDRCGPKRAARGSAAGTAQDNGAKSAVTEGEERAALDGPRNGSPEGFTQNEAPDHGGTTGGFASAGGPLNRTLRT